MFSESEIPVLMLRPHKKSFNGSVIHNDWPDQLVHSIFIDLPLSKCWNPSTLNIFALKFKHVPFYHLVLMDFFFLFFMKSDSPRPCECFWSFIVFGDPSGLSGPLHLSSSLHFKHSIYFLYEMDLVDWIIFTVGGSLWAWNVPSPKSIPNGNNACLASRDGGDAQNDSWYSKPIGLCLFFW